MRSAARVCLWLLAAFLMATPYLKVSGNGRYLIDAANGDVPFLVNGDSPWGLATGWKISAQANTNAPSSSDVTSYLDDRQTRGVNAILLSPVYHDNATGLMGATPNGDRPYTSNDIAQPVEAFFSYLDGIISACATRGITCWITPFWFGFAGNPEDMLANVLTGAGYDKVYQAGRYWGNRYKNQDNIVWVIGGDQSPGSTTRKLYHALALGIAATDTVKPKLMTGQMARSGDSAAEFLGWAWHKVVGVYQPSDHTVYEQLRANYAAANRKPGLLLEAYYEGEHSMTAQQVRRNVYHALTSGACGHFFGNHPIWDVASGWQSAFGSTGAQDMARAYTLFSGLAWHRLVPDTAHAVVTSGYGTDGADDHVTVARTPDASLGIIYVPVHNTAAPVVDMTKFRGLVTAKAWDISNGTSTTLSGGGWANTGTRTLSDRGLNAGGARDYVYTFEAA